MAIQIIEGTWAEVEQQMQNLAIGQSQHVKVLFDEPVPVPDSNAQELPLGKMMSFGMFPELKNLKEEDFQSAEFHGDPDDGLDWP